MSKMPREDIVYFTERHAFEGKCPKKPSNRMICGHIIQKVWKNNQIDSEKGLFWTFSCENYIFYQNLQV